jgi:YVTN family beta-propeller protein
MPTMKMSRWGAPIALLAALGLVGHAARAEGKQEGGRGADAGEAPAPPALEVQEVAYSGSMPKGTTRSHDGKHYYVTNFGQLDKRSVTIFDAVTLSEVGHIDLPGVVVESVLSPDGKTLYVSNFRRSSVMFVDLATKKLTREVKVGTHPKILAVTRDGKRLFSANWASDDVTEIDVATATVTRTLKTGKAPRGMVVTANGTLYVANFYSKSIDVFRGPEMADRHRIPTCNNPRHLALSPKEKTLYITCLNASELHAMDIASEKVTHTAPVGKAPKSVSVSRDGRYAYTADYGTSRSISVVDTKTWTSRTFPVPGMDRGSGVAVAPDGKSALVTGWYDGHVYLVGFEGTGGHPGAALRYIRRWRHSPHHADPGDGS